ncbi:HAD-IA family hydrolase [Sediminicola arcticus]|jgi:HAD superfamily hydrolase (TIGR01509 family)|uniref:HAD-IA family hydrolase n=1 Tax=Sediminicola arcticus TaxID=1574308 RepID=A0ABV2ST55_9FLAO
MFKNIIFDFGDIFINLDKQAPLIAMEKWGLKDVQPSFTNLLFSYEKGLLDSETFLSKMSKYFPTATIQQIKTGWNSIILDFPEYRLEFIEKMAEEKEYNLILLSNTNALHIEKVIENMGEARFERFKKCFDQFYLSHEINLRKPDTEIYQFVLDSTNLKASETFFVDDTQENTLASEKSGITSWNLQVGKEDIVELISKM